MDLKYLSVKEEVQNQRVQVVHIGTHDMIADPLTKGLAPKTFIGHISKMGVAAKSLYIGYVTPQKYPRIFIIILLYILGMN